VRWLLQTLAVARVFLRRYLFHPVNLAATLVLPVMIALIFGSADERAATNLPLGAVVEGASPSGEQFIDTLEAEPGVTVRMFEDRAQLLRAVRRTDVVGGVVVPEGFDAAPGGAQVLLIADDGDPLHAAAGIVTTAVAGRFGADPATYMDRIEIAPALASEGGRSLGFPRAAAGMLVYWVFANAMFAAALITEDRRRGMLSRLASTPTPAMSIVVGEVGGRFFVALGQSIVVAFVSSLVLGTAWGAVVPLAAVLITASAVAAGLSVLLGVSLRGPTTQSATAALAAAGVLGLLGGCFWATDFVPPVMRTVAKLTPHAWVIDALDELVAQNAGVVDIAPQLAVLGLLAVALVVLAAARLRHALLAPVAAT